MGRRTVSMQCVIVPGNRLNNCYIAQVIPRHGTGTFASALVNRPRLVATLPAPGNFNSLQSMMTRWSRFFERDVTIINELYPSASVTLSHHQVGHHAVASNACDVSC